MLASKQTTGDQPVIDRRHSRNKIQSYLVVVSIVSIASVFPSTSDLAWMKQIADENNHKNITNRVFQTNTTICHNMEIKINNCFQQGREIIHVYYAFQETVQTFLGVGWLSLADSLELLRWRSLRFSLDRSVDSSPDDADDDALRIHVTNHIIYLPAVVSQYTWSQAQMVNTCNIEIRNTID